MIKLDEKTDQVDEYKPVELASAKNWNDDDCLTEEKIKELKIFLEKKDKLGFGGKH